MNDPFGSAIQDYLEKGKATDIIVNSNYTEGESIPVNYLFRTIEEMPEIEKMALKRCKGKILDIGAAAGCHSMVLQKKGYNVTALEKSEKAAEAMQKRGLMKVVAADIYEYEEETFDTILMLMNGTGIGGTIHGLQKLLYHIKKLLKNEGQILLDSSDIKYLFEEEDGSYWVDLASDKYYGEMQYEISYKKENDAFNWLFVDFETLKNTAVLVGLNCEKLHEGEHFDYLAKLYK